MATCVSCGLTGCGDDKKDDDTPQCDEALKPATATSCDCVDGSWQFCIYPAGDKCATSNCGAGTVCDPNTGDCVPSGGGCKCDDGSDCPNGDKAQCPTATDACEGKACKAAGTCSDNAGVCACNNGGDIADDCVAATDACDGKACKDAGTCSDNDGVCECNNGGDIADDCAAATDACDGKPCKDAGTCSDNAGVCECNNGGEIADDCVLASDACDGKACKDAGTCSDNDGVCECNNGGDIDDDCVLASDACEGKACKDAGTCSDVSGTCTCNNGGEIADDCVLATDACEGKACKDDGTCSDDGGVCKCTNEFTLDNNCKSACEGKTLPEKATSCSECFEETGTWNEATCEYPACVDDGKKTAATCDCEKGVWANCDFCKGVTLLSGQVCDSATGDVTYDPAPALIVDGVPTSINEDTDPDTDEIPVVTIKLNAEPSKDVKVTITGPDDQRAGIYTLYSGNDWRRLGNTYEQTIEKSKWDEGFNIKFAPYTMNNNAVDGNIDSKFTITASSDDPAFNSMAAVEKTITIIDDDQPGIVLNCEKDLIQMSWAKIIAQAKFYTSKKDDDNGITDTQVCTVKLSKAPTADVTVQLTATPENNTLLIPDVQINGTALTGALTTTTLTFTKDNYNKKQTINLKFHTETVDPKDIPDTKSLKYTLAVKSDTTNYQVAEISKEFSVRPMAKYIVFNTKGYKKPNKLPKGKYRLHAWGASGGLATDANMAIDTSFNEGFQCANHGGAGAYIRGELTLTEATDVYVYVGEAGKGNGDGCDAAYNGGGQGYCSINYPAASGGGGTDFCIGHEDCKTLDKHWPYRILIAGGGGGGTQYASCKTSSDNFGGVGGSATWQGESGPGSCLVSHQCSGWSVGGRTAGSACTVNPDVTKLGNSGYGVGASGGGEWNPQHYGVGGGGGGWYGGYFATKFNTDLGGGAGSSWAFKGSNAAEDCNGKQIDKYALSKVAGQDGLDAIGENIESGVDDYFPFFKDYENRVGDIMNITAHEAPQMGNIGDGYAVIEVLYDE
ncbi:MAG: hypothetical protein J6A01_04890 [Proteobacteria bacterium]|nr:hypothetical protein [Pseudomonadota bacterium]